MKDVPVSPKLKLEITDDIDAPIESTIGLRLKIIDVKTGRTEVEK